MEKDRSQVGALKPRHLFKTAVAVDSLVLVLCLAFTPLLACGFVQHGWILLCPVALFVWSYLIKDDWLPAILFFGTSLLFWFWLLGHAMEFVRLLNN